MESREQDIVEQNALGLDGEEEAQYESDSEDGTSALTLRRQVASDVEDDEHELSTEKERAYYDEDGEECQGVPPDEEDDQEEEEEEEEYADSEDAMRASDTSDEDDKAEEKLNQSRSIIEHGVVGTIRTIESPKDISIKEGVEEHKQAAEPFVVPTTGAFYMHDDRFRNNGAVRARRSTGGRRLWEAKDEQRWVHDRFEELKLNEERYITQSGRGRRGRGNDGRAQSRGRGSRHKDMHEKDFEENVKFPARRVRGRGRGIRRARMDDYEFRDMKPSRIRNDNRISSTPKSAVLQPTGKSEEAVFKKPPTISVLNSKSPPFFPTGAGTPSISGQPSRSKTSDEKGRADRHFTQPGSMVITTRSTAEKAEKGLMKANPTAVTRSSSTPGNIVSLISDPDLGEVDRSFPRGPNVLKQPLMKTVSGSILQQQRPLKAGVVQHVSEQASPSSLSQQPQQTRGTPSQLLRLQQSQQPAQAITSGQLSRGQSMSAQSLISPNTNAIQPAKDLKGVDMPLGNKAVNTASQRGTQAETLSAGRGSLLYGGSTLTNGLRSVVQFAGQPQSNLGVPSVGVALPGYSTQPQFGFPNSEVTWIPILAGGGSLSSNYNNSYIAVNGSSPAVYYNPQAPQSQQASQTSSFPVLGRETNSLKTASGGSFNPPARPEADEFGQQRRRYSQMTFGEERR